MKIVTCAVPAAAMSAAAMLAVSWVPLTKVVVRSVPFQRTTEPETKFVPVTVKVNPAPPAWALFGDSWVNVGAGLLTVNVRAEDVPPPGAGVNTVTCAVPAGAMSAAGIAAVSCVPLTNVVVRSVPFQRTTEPVTKFVPVTVSVKADPPTVALLGERELSPGTGLSRLNGRDEEVPPPGAGLNTVTCAVPAVVMSAARMAAVSWVALTNVVVRSVPFQRTTDPETKFVPVTVRVNAAPPAGPLLGDNCVSVGPWLLIVNV